MAEPKMYVVTVRIYNPGTSLPVGTRLRTVGPGQVSEYEPNRKTTFQVKRYSAYIDSSSLSGMLLDVDGHVDVEAQLYGRP